MLFTFNEGLEAFRVVHQILVDSVLGKVVVGSAYLPLKSGFKSFVVVQIFMVGSGFIAAKSASFDVDS